MLYDSIEFGCYPIKKKNHVTECTTIIPRNFKSTYDFFSYKNIIRLRKFVL